jgi:hypothetical protein
MHTKCRAKVRSLWNGPMQNLIPRRVRYQVFISLQNSISDSSRIKDAPSKISCWPIGLQLHATSVNVLEVSWGHKYHGRDSRIEMGFPTNWELCVMVFKNSAKSHHEMLRGLIVRSHTTLRRERKTDTGWNCESPPEWSQSRWCEGFRLERYWANSERDTLSYNSAKPNSRPPENWRAGLLYRNGCWNLWC